MITQAIWDAQSNLITAQNAQIGAMKDGLPAEMQNTLSEAQDLNSALLTLTLDQDDFSTRTTVICLHTKIMAAIEQQQRLSDLQLSGVRIDLGIAQFDFFGKELFVSP